jgi:hypothetical protein
MSDYYPLLSRAVAGLDTNTGESRRALYGRARAALCEQLRGHEPPLTGSDITRERLSLEAAIRKFEAEAIRRPRNARVTDPIGAAGDNGIDTGPFVVPATGARVESVRIPATRLPGEQRAAPREQLVELAVLAQVIEAREEQVRKPTGTARDGNLLGTTRQHRPAAAQRISSSQQVQRVTTARDFLTKLIEVRQGVWPGNDAGPSSHLGKRSLPDAPRTGDFITPLLYCLYFVLGFAQLVAFFHGLQMGFGFGGVASIGIFMLLYLTGSLGSIPMAIVSFYGAWRGWQWPIWAAALLAFPFVILSFAFLGIGGFYSFFNRQKAPPIVEVIRSLLKSPRWRERTRRWRAGLARFLWNYPGAPARRPRRPRARR